MRAILDFIGNNGVGIIIFFLLFGGGIYSFLSRIIEQRHQRKLEAARHEHKLQIMVERRRIAETAGDAIKILLADNVIGADFDQRLRVALNEVKAKDASASMGTHELEDEDAEPSEKKHADLQRQ